MGFQEEDARARVEKEEKQEKDSLLKEIDRVSDKIEELNVNGGIETEIDNMRMTLTSLQSQLRPSSVPAQVDVRRESSRLYSAGAKGSPKRTGQVLSPSALLIVGAMENNDGDETDCVHARIPKVGEKIPDHRITVYVKERNPRNRPQSFVDKKIQQVKENRISIMLEKEAAIKKRVNDQIERKRQYTERQYLQALQTSWMMIISRFARVNVMVNAVFYERHELLRWKNASRDEKSVRDIEIWWPRQYIIFKLYKKFPWTRFALATLFMNRWRKLRIAQRYASQALIVRFVSDVTGLGETMRKIYVFRLKVRRCQEWVYMYFKLYFARLQVLWKALQREEERLKKVVAQGARIKNRRDNMLIKCIKGFGEKLDKIDQVSSNISTLLKFQEGLDSRRMLKVSLTRREKSIRMSSRTVSQMRQWKTEMESTENGAEKMEFLEQLLRELRHANVVKNDAMKHRTIGKGPRADEHDARAFLKSNNNNPMPKLAETLSELEDPTIKRSRRSPFYMLTGNGGALDVIREWCERYMRSKYFEEFQLVDEQGKNPTYLLKRS